MPNLQVLFSASIEENIKFGRPEATLEEVRAAAAAANAGFVDALPEGFSTQVRCRHSDGKHLTTPFQLCAVTRAAPCVGCTSR